MCECCEGIVGVGWISLALSMFMMVATERDVMGHENNVKAGFSGGENDDVGVYDVMILLPTDLYCNNQRCVP